MTTKRFTSLVLIFAANLAAAQGITTYPEWKVTVKVVDEDDRPVADAKVGVGSSTNLVDFNLERMTDTNGMVTVSAHAAGTVGCVTEKPGYYMTVGPSKEFRDQVNGRWQPWNPLLEVTLRHVGMPIPMYAKRVEGGPPILGKSVGYDLMSGDWVAPRGQGKQSDMIFSKVYQEKSASDYYSKIEVTFPHPGDGIQLFQPSVRDMTSTFKSAYQAPENGYQRELTREISARPGQPSKFEYDPNRIYFFRGTDHT